MSTARTQFLDDVAAILGNDRLFGAATLNVTRDDIPGGDANAILLSLPHAAVGWLCTGSAIHTRRTGGWAHVSGTPSQTPDFMQVVSGEFALNTTSSLHLRRVAGALVAFRFMEIEAAPANANLPSMAVVTEDTELVSTEAGLRLRYRTYRKETRRDGGDLAVTTWEPWLSRFTGFSPRNEVSA